MLNCVKQNIHTYMLESVVNKKNMCNTGKHPGFPNGLQKNKYNLW